MARQIFRQEALDRLASPDQLDRPVRVVHSLAWLGLSAVFAAALSAAVWAAIAEAPVKIRGQGILIREGGVFEITASEPGRIQELLLRPGQIVEEGETVAVINQSDLARQYENAEVSLTAAKDRLSSLTRFYQESNDRKREADRERLETIEQTEGLLQDRLVLLKERRDNIRGLVDQGQMVRSRLIEADVDLSNSMERLAALDDERVEIRLRQIEDESQRDVELLNQRLNVEEFEREVDRLSKLLAQRRVLTSPHDGRIAEVKVNAGDVVQAGSALATVTPSDDQSPDDLTALLYVPPQDGKRIKPGMRVEIDLSTVKREEFGYIIGTVLDVSPLPATFEGMRRVLQNDQLVEQLSGEGAPFEATVALERSADTQTGFRWSTARGADIDINAGTLFDGRVVIRHLRLLSLLVPEFERVFGANDV